MTLKELKDLIDSLIELSDQDPEDIELFEGLPPTKRVKVDAELWDYLGQDMVAILIEED